MLLYPNAKINIGLNVVEKREDGYHNIETIFYPIGLTDILEVETSDSCSEYSFSAAGIPVGGDPDDNLIVKAYRLLRVDYEFPPIDISLIKQIPFGAGLGGGSADAAFMLNALNNMYQLNISTEELEEYAACLGADCPVFIQNKPVYASGIGNVFTDIDLSLEGKFLLLVKPDIHVSTPEAYSLVTPQKSDINLIEAVKRPVEEWKNLIRNDFEKSVFVRYPEIAAIKQKIYDMGAVYASMSGSGSAVFGIFDDMPADNAEFEKYFVAAGQI